MRTIANPYHLIKVQYLSPMETRKWRGRKWGGTKPETIDNHLLM